MKMILALLFALSACARVKTLSYKNEHSTISASRELATVYFLREKHLNAVNLIIHDGADSLGILSSESFFVVQLKPGAHAFSYSTSQKRNVPQLELNLEKNETYYIALSPVTAEEYRQNRINQVKNYAGEFKILSDEEGKTLTSTLREIDLDQNAPLYKK